MFRSNLVVRIVIKPVTRSFIGDLICLRFYEWCGFRRRFVWIFCPFFSLKNAYKKLFVQWCLRCKVSELFDKLIDVFLRSDILGIITVFRVTSGFTAFIDRRYMVALETQ